MGYREPAPTDWNQFLKEHRQNWIALDTETMLTWCCDSMPAVRRRNGLIRYECKFCGRTAPAMPTRDEAVQTWRAANPNHEFGPSKNAVMTITKVISVRQPWPWLILHAGKDIENRTWKTKYRGECYLHAAKTMYASDYREAVQFAHNIDPNIQIPAPHDLEKGGIVGKFQLVDCVTQSDSPWYMGDIGFVLEHPQALPYIPLKGKLNIFEIDINKIPNWPVAA